jgi:carbon-monoxide dehydrogenase small subunit
MNPIRIDINGETHEALTEPRQHLGDFLRETCRLTGTHLGCEHGVCGACTVLLDDRPVRSCIAFAVACEGARVRTIEGFEGDPVMAELRAAFTRHHALQCGFCTPGMLIAARDLVLRLPEADEARVRVEMSGNLCRCTGFAGIVAAILEVLANRRSANAPTLVAPEGSAARPHLATFSPALEADPARQSRAEAAGEPAPGAMVGGPMASGSVASGSMPGGADSIELSAAPEAGATRIEAFFVLRGSPAAVWADLADVGAVAACLPGAEDIEIEGNRVRGRLVVRFGPMRASFAGAAVLERDEARQVARLRGAGQDSLSRSRARADIVYRLAPILGDGQSPTDLAVTGMAATRVSITMDYTLQGPLAQFSRSSLVQDFAARLVTDLGARFEARRAQGTVAGQGEATKAGGINALSLLWQVVCARVARWFGRDAGRS